MQDLSDKNDRELISNFLSGDVNSYLELTSRYTEKVGNLALRITRSPEDAEEIMQDVFVTVYRKLDKFKGTSAFSSWLYRITMNTSFMVLRKRKKHLSVALDDAHPQVPSAWATTRSDTCDVEAISTRHELREKLEEAVSKLPDDYRAIFVMRDIDGFSNQEVAEILDITVPAVKSRLHRSRLMLRKKLARYYEDYTRSDVLDYGPATSWV